MHAGNARTTRFIVHESKVAKFSRQTFMEADLILLLAVTVQELISHAGFVHGFACGTPSLIFHNPLPCPVFSSHK